MVKEHIMKLLIIQLLIFS